MKRFFGFVLVTVVLSLSSCATISSTIGSTISAGMNYSALAKEQSFDSFFPSPSSTHYFATLDEAYDWVNIAQAKFTSSSGKSRAKGLSAKLIGPTVKNEQPVTVSYFMAASTRNNSIDLSKIERTLEAEIKDAVSATLVFLVFYQDRGTSISNFHLKSGYTYNTNTQYSSFTYKNETYDAEYPTGWGVDKAFSYLRKEID